MISLVVALVTAAPYPQPWSIADTPGLRFATGTIASVGPMTLVVATDAGPLELQTGQSVVLDEDHRDRELRSVALGRTVNVWYVVNDGAIAREIDLVTPQPPPVQAPTDASVKTATGTIAAYDATLTHMVVATPAGLVTFAIDRTPVFGRDHKPRNVRKLANGTWVTVTYVVDNGARAQRIDLTTPPVQKPVG
jgi:hypothetical protein